MEMMTRPVNVQHDAVDCDDAADAVVAVASRYAGDVDRAGRFPVEAVAAMREQGLLSLAIPTRFGGRGATLEEVANVARRLGEACASSAMIFAMHHAQFYCLLDHAADNPWYRQLFADVAERQYLVASATSEDRVGGDLRSSLCHIHRVDDEVFTFSKRAPTVSYGAYADIICATARHAADAPASQQVLVTLLKSDLTLEPISGWDTLGMRGTCSGGFVLHAGGLLSQVVDAPFSNIANETMLPVSHILWASVWLGIATDALRRGQKSLRKKARHATPENILSGARLAEAVGMFRVMETTLHGATQSLMRHRARRHSSDPAQAATATLTPPSTATYNELKVRMSTLAVQIVSQVMMVGGISAYKNDSPYSVGRHLRDLHSAPLMVNNDRLTANMATLVLAERIG